MASFGESRQDPARADRGATRQLPRRGRHRAGRRRLQAVPGGDEIGRPRRSTGAAHTSPMRPRGFLAMIRRAKSARAGKEGDTMRYARVAALATMLVPGSAFSQAPTLTTDWTPMNMSQAECMVLAERVMQNAGLSRIERVGASVFADSYDQLNQVTIRCVAERQMAFVVAAGRHADARITEGLTNMLIRAFRERRY